MACRTGRENAPCTQHLGLDGAFQNQQGVVGELGAQQAEERADQVELRQARSRAGAQVRHQAPEHEQGRALVRGRAQVDQVEKEPGCLRLEAREEALAQDQDQLLDAVVLDTPLLGEPCGAAVAVGLERQPQKAPPRKRLWGAGRGAYLGTTWQCLAGC